MKYLIAFSRLNSLLELLLHAVYTKSDLSCIGKALLRVQ